MRADILGSAALLLLGPAPASVAEQPRLLPTHDVAVVYRAPGPRGTEAEERVRWLAAAQTMRIDLPNHNLRLIVDYRGKRMSVIDDANRSVVEMATPDHADSMAGATVAASYTRRGQGVVAGHPCTEWQALDSQGRAALVCVTEDGVLLRAGTPGTVRVTAIVVQYGPQDAAAFRIPADYARVAPDAPR